MLEAIETCYPECVLNLDLVRHLKEKHGSVGLASSAVVVSLPTKSAGVEEFDITEVLQKHCQQFANEIGRAAVELIERINFGYRQETLGNIVLAGGGQSVEGIRHIC